MAAEIPCGSLIKQIHDAMEKQSNNALRSQNLTLSQVTVLLLLAQAPEKQATLKDIEKRLAVAQSTAAGIVARLQQKGFVEGLTDPADKRIKWVRLTQKGEDHSSQAQASMEAADRLLLSGLDRQEQKTLVRLLTIIHHSVQRQPVKKPEDASTIG